MPRGGKRPGSGPKAPDGPMTSLTVRLDRELREALDALCVRHRASAGSVVRMALAELAKR